MYGQSLPVGTYTLAALAVCKVIKQPRKLLAVEFTEFLFVYLHGDKAAMVCTMGCSRRALLFIYFDRQAVGIGEKQEMFSCEFVRPDFFVWYV